MARTVLTPITLGTLWQTTLTTVTFSTVDVANGNAVLATGREIMIFDNTDSGARVVTITGFADARGRSQNIAFSLPATPSGVYITQMFPVLGWKQADGYLYIDCPFAINIAVLKVPQSLA